MAVPLCGHLLDYFYLVRSLLQQMVAPRCPACDTGKLFASSLRIVARCNSCGLDLRNHDSGDGPTFFVILFVGFLITTGASVVEYHFSPALWVHALLWIPLTFLCCIVLLRFFKVMLITFEYRLNRLKENPSDDSSVS